MLMAMAMKLLASYNAYTPTFIYLHTTHQIVKTLLQNNAQAWQSVKAGSKVSLGCTCNYGACVWWRNMCHFVCECE